MCCIVYKSNTLNRAHETQSRAHVDDATHPRHFARRARGNDRFPTHKNPARLSSGTQLNEYLPVGPGGMSPGPPASANPLDYPARPPTLSFFLLPQEPSQRPSWNPTICNPNVIVATVGVVFAASTLPPNPLVRHLVRLEAFSSFRRTPDAEPVGDLAR